MCGSDRNTKPRAILFLAAALPAGIGFARQEPQTCGTHALRSSEEIALHAASHRSLPFSAKLRAVKRGASRDEGSIFVLEDQGDIITRRNPFNLDGRGIFFRATDAAGSAYRYGLGQPGFDTAAAAMGTPVAGLGDDDSALVALPFSFPYFGQRYTSLFLNSDGNLTFGGKDDASASRTAGRATTGFPRISGLYRDLDPSRVFEGVRVLLESQRAVFTWNEVPDYQDFGTGPRNTFQIRIYPGGGIEFSYQSIGTRTAVVGLGRGQIGAKDAIVAFSQGGEGREFAGSVIERFTDVQEIDTVFAASRFFEMHDDSFDFLAFYNDQGIPSGDGTIAWESTVRNEISGINDRFRDDGIFYSSPSRLQGILSMGPLDQYPDDPYGVVLGRITSGDTPMSVLGHELGHRWLAYVSVRDPGISGDAPMLGRQGAHWSFAFNSDASLLEGNRIADNGEFGQPRFTTVATTQGFSLLDQYLMGLVPPAAVPPTFYVANPSIFVQSRSPQTGISFDGTRRDVLIDELVERYGSRQPDHEIAQRHFRVAIVLVTRAGSPAFAGSLAKVDRFRREFAPYFERVTGGRASVDTSLRPGVWTSYYPAVALAADSDSEIWVGIERPRPGDLTLRVSAGSGIAVPEQITIRAGTTVAKLPVRALDPGVAEVRVSDAAGELAPAFAAVRVVKLP
jgi:hypothetical protein